jgi:hypothetical protein
VLRRSELPELSAGVAIGCITTPDSRKRSLTGGLTSGDKRKTAKEANKKDDVL